MKQKLLKNVTKQKGITLIALVITIIVLLILAGVSIAMLTGQNGILTRASQAREENMKAQVIEEARVDILAKQTEKSGGNPTADELEQILTPQYGTLSDEENILDRTLTTADGYQIPVKDIWNGILAEETKIPISKTSSYVGYYADIDGDGGVDGIIYADLAMGNTGTGGIGAYTYTIPTVSATNLKDYYIKETGHDEGSGFGTKDVIAPIEDSNGTDRFYVMALTDVGEGQTYSWYSNTENLGTLNTEREFGTGKTNTLTMINEWNSDSNRDETKDIWGQITDGWFVPSLDEWSAFKGELGIDKNNYNDRGLSLEYWSSSGSLDSVYIIMLSFDLYSRQNIIEAQNFVRLSTTL